jgi:hypothetical protein
MRIAGQRIPDLNSGLRAFRRSCVQQYFPLLSNQFSFTTTLTLSLLCDDYRVVYHTIDYYPRIGKSKIVPRHFMDFIILILRLAVLFQPLKVFVPVSFLCGLLGVLKVLFDVVAFFTRNPPLGWSLVFEAMVSSSALLLLLAALQVLLIGVVADALLRRTVQQNGSLMPSHSDRVSELDPISQDQKRGIGLSSTDRSLRGRG